MDIAHKNDRVNLSTSSETGGPIHSLGVGHLPSSRTPQLQPQERGGCTLDNRSNTRCGERYSARLGSPPEMPLKGLDMWPYPWTHVGTPSHLGSLTRVTLNLPSQAPAGSA